MIILSQTTDNLQVVLGGSVTTNQLQCLTVWRDVTTTAYTPGRTVTDTNNTTDVNLASAPAASTQRIIDYINIYNKDTVVQTVTVKFDANGTEYILWKGDLLSGSRLEYQDGKGFEYTSSASQGYTIHIQALTSSPTDAQTIYFGNLPKAPVTAAATSKIYIRKAGTLKVAQIYCYSGTAGTAESWSIYVRVNNTTDYLIQALTVSASERVFTNSALSVLLSAGDYVEIKSVNPTWATNPLTTIFGGYLYIE